MWGKVTFHLAKCKIDSFGITLMCKAKVMIRVRNEKSLPRRYIIVGLAVFILY
jgi:hypothetical protein